MIKRFAVGVILCFAAVGCGSSVRIYKSTSLAEPPKGIPFYAKTAVCRQETVWLEPQYILSYESKSGANSFGPVDKVLSRHDFNTNAVQAFIQAPVDSSAWESTIVALKSPGSVNESDGEAIRMEESNGNWVRSSNTSSVDTVVDYGNVFYFNSARPLAGSTQVDAKLNADGTLSEGSGQLQDQTLATITSTISSLVSTAKVAATILGLDAQTEIKLSVKTRTYKHTHSQYLGSWTPAKPDTCPPLSSGVFGGAFTVTEVSDSPSAKPTSQENTITVSGSIVLPKASTPNSPASAPVGQPSPPKK